MPAQLIERLAALFFGAVFFKEFVQTKAFLKLNHVFGHNRNPPIFSGFHYLHVTGSMAEPRG
jgi:hypothetical protein